MKLRIPVISGADEQNLPWPRALVGFLPPLHRFSDQQRWWSYVSGIQSQEERLRKINRMSELQRACEK